MCENTVIEYSYEENYRKLPIQILDEHCLHKSQVVLHVQCFLFQLHSISHLIEILSALWIKVARMNNLKNTQKCEIYCESEIGSTIGCASSYKKALVIPRKM